MSFIPSTYFFVLLWCFLCVVGRHARRPVIVHCHSTGSDRRCRLCSPHSTKHTNQDIKKSIVFFYPPRCPPRHRPPPPPLSRSRAMSMATRPMHLPPPHYQARDPPPHRQWQRHHRRDDGRSHRNTIHQHTGICTHSIA